MPPRAQCANIGLKCEFDVVSPNLNIRDILHCFLKLNSWFWTSQNRMKINFNDFSIQTKSKSINFHSETDKHISQIIIKKWLGMH